MAGGAPSKWKVRMLEWLGPRPRYRDALPALLGLVGGILVIVTGIGIDTLLAKKTQLDPGAALTWLFVPAVLAAALAFVIGRRGWRAALLLVAATTICLLPATHPDPKWWMAIGPGIVAVAVLALDLPPAGRVVAALPSLLGVMLLTDTLGGSGNLAPLLAAAYVLVLWFVLPYASGWRRVPFLVHATLALIVVLALLGVVVASMVSTGITVPKRLDNDVDFLGALSTIGILLVLVAYPAGVFLMWRSRRLQEVTVPTVPLPPAMRAAPPPSA